jgi:hypothetical protein
MLGLTMDRVSSCRLLGSLALVVLSACSTETREDVDDKIERSREVVDDKIERSREVVDEQVEVARDRLADAGAEIEKAGAQLERSGRKGLREAGEGLDRWLAEGREQLGSGDDYKPIAGADEAIQCKTDTRCTIDPAFIDRLSKDPLVLANEAVVLPTQGNSERGLALSNVRPGSIPEQLGLLDGDVLISLNGTNLASLDAPGTLADALSNTDEATLVFERANQQRTLTIVRTAKP